MLSVYFCYQILLLSSSEIIQIVTVASSEISLILWYLLISGALEASFSVQFLCC